MPKHKPRLTFAQTLRHRINAGRVALKNQIDFFERNLGLVSSDWKEDNTRVTFVDYAISEKIFAELKTSFPQDHYLSEESNPTDETIELTSAFSWVLDPIDGTNNYFLGIPVCAISLALLHKGTPIYGYVYDLSRKRLIQGGPKFGLQDGCERAKVIEGDLDTRYSAVAMHFPMSAAQLQAMQPLLETYRVRSSGSAALNIAYSAIGKLVGTLDYKVKVWDIAAGYALILAGGGEFRYCAEPVFPLQTFSVTSDFTPCYAGSQAFVRYVDSLLHLSC